MAGVPPLLGFVGKEAAFTALLDGGLPDRTAAVVVLAVLVVGLGADRRLHAAVLVGRVRPQARAARPRPRRARPPAGRAVPRRARGRWRWPGSCSAPPARCWSRWSPGTPTTLPLLAARGARSSRSGTAGSRRSLLSAISLLGGAALFAARTPVNRLQRRFAVGASADEGYWNVIQGLDRLSVLVTGTTQRGSLPAYLGTILVVVLALPGTLLITRAPVARRVAGLGHPGAGAGRRRHPDRGRRWRCGSGSGCPSSSSSASPATGRPCCSPSRARPTSRSPSSWSRR